MLAEGTSTNQYPKLQAALASRFITIRALHTTLLRSTPTPDRRLLRPYLSIRKASTVSINVVAEVVGIGMGGVDGVVITTRRTITAEIGPVSNSARVPPLIRSRWSLHQLVGRRSERPTLLG